MTLMALMALMALATVAAVDAVDAVGGVDTLDVPLLLTLAPDPARSQVPDDELEVVRQVKKPGGRGRARGRARRR